MNKCCQDKNKKWRNCVKN